MSQQVRDFLIGKKIYKIDSHGPRPNYNLEVFNAIRDLYLRHSHAISSPIDSIIYARTDISFSYIAVQKEFIDLLNTRLPNINIVQINHSLPMYHQDIRDIYRLLNENGLKLYDSVVDYRYPEFGDGLYPKRHYYWK